MSKPDKISYRFDKVKSTTLDQEVSNLPETDRPQYTQEELIVQLLQHIVEQLVYIAELLDKKNP